MAPIRLDHIHLRTTDVAATAQWYVTMLGGQVVGPEPAPGAASAIVDLGDARLLIAGAQENEGLLPAALQGRLGLDHFGLAVTDLEGLVAELRARGVPIVREPFDLRAGGRGAFIAAPDQVRIELLERR